MCKKYVLLSVLAIFVSGVSAQIANVALFSAMYHGHFDQPVVITPVCAPAPVVALKSVYPTLPAATSTSFIIHEAVSETENAMAAASIINTFFTALEKGSTGDLRNACTKDVRFQTHMQDQTGNHHIFDENIQDMVRFAASNGAGNYGVDIEYQLLPPDASATGYRAMYIFYLNGYISHCGVCSFEMGKTDEGWKIKRMIDTRSRKCN